MYLHEVFSITDQLLRYRSEIDRLTELLHSRTIEFPVRDEGKLTEANHSNPPSNLERHEEFPSNPMQENRNERDKFIGIATPAVSSQVRLNANVLFFVFLFDALVSVSLLVITVLL